MKAQTAGASKRQRVFVDTNVVIEAFRINCWAALTNRYAVETVEKCIEEALTGNTSYADRIQIDPKIMLKGLTARHTVTKLTLATFVLEHPECAGLDDGELHLLAWLKQHFPNRLGNIVLSTADKAAIVASHRLNWLDAVVCLESLAQEAGVSRQQVRRLAPQHRKTWLEALKLTIRLK